MAIKEISKEATKSKPSLKYQRDKMREKVTGIFHFYEVPGGGISFNYREFKEDPIERFDLVDGETYTIPLGVARHLNKNGSYPEYGYFNSDGLSGVKQSAQPAENKVMRVAKKIRRFGFQSLEFVDIEDLPTAHSQIVEVQTVV